MPNIGRHLAIDLGDRRTGLAICDEEGILASPLDVLDEPDRNLLLKSLVEVCARERVSAIVMGMPFNMDGTEGPRAKLVRDFAKRLEAASSLGVAFEDERLSTHAAEDMLRSAGMGWRERKGKVDASSAVVILESYLQRVFGREKRPDVDPGHAGWHKPGARQRARREKGERRRR